jgi:calcineurin-like phosphoesterase family protein
MMATDMLPHYFTSDLHLGHERCLIYDNRPWSDIRSHDEAVMQALRPHHADKNRSPQLWILGDVSARREGTAEMLKAIRPYWSKIHLIRGNHDDKAAWRLRDEFDSANEALYLRITPTIKVYLSHYAHRVWRNSHHGAYHLHGHSHGALMPQGRSMDVGIMLHRYKPLSLGNVIDMLHDQHETKHH